MNLKEKLQQRDNYILTEEQLREVVTALDRYYAPFKERRRRFLIVSGDFIDIIYTQYNGSFDYGYIEGITKEHYYEDMEELAYLLMYDAGFEEFYGEVYSLQTFELICEF